MIEYDNRHLWMKLKSIKGSHFANYREAWDANALVCEGKILPPLSAVYPLAEVGEARLPGHRNLHEGKIGVLCLAPSEGLGIDDHELRERVGEDRITLFAATAHDRRPHEGSPHVHRDRPRGPLPSTTSTRPSTGTPRTSGRPSPPPRARRVRRREEALGRG